MGQRVICHFERSLCEFWGSEEVSLIWNTYVRVRIECDFGAVEQITALFLLRVRMFLQWIKRSGPLVMWSGCTVPTAAVCSSPTAVGLTSSEQVERHQLGKVPVMKWSSLGWNYVSQYFCHIVSLHWILKSIVSLFIVGESENPEGLRRQVKLMTRAWEIDELVSAQDTLVKGREDKNYLKNFMDIAKETKR